MENKDKVYKYIVDNQKDIMCDYIELRDKLKLKDDEISKILKELIKEKKIKPNIGGYVTI